MIKVLLFDFSRVILFPKDKNYTGKLIFKKIYSALEIGLDKKDPKAYSLIAQDLGLKPEEIVFIDDSLENLSAAKSAGLSTIWYQSNDKLFEDVKTLGL